jgi:hypothetical protein
MVMHEDEHAIVKDMLIKALGDDNWLAKAAPKPRSEGQRVQDRLALSRFLERMERQFDRRSTDLA